MGQCFTISSFVKYFLVHFGNNSVSTNLQATNLLPRPLPDFISQLWDKVWEWPGNDADMFMKSQQELVSTETYECTSWRWLRKELSVLPVNCGVCLPHNWRTQCMIFVALYPGSSPCRKTGEEPGYETTNIIHSVLQLWCVSASQWTIYRLTVVTQWSLCGLWILVIKGCVSWQRETLTLFMGSFSAGKGCTLGNKRLWRLYDISS